MYYRLIGAYHKFLSLRMNHARKMQYISNKAAVNSIMGTQAHYVMGQYESRLQLDSLQLLFQVGKVKEMKFLDGSILDKNFYVNYTPF